MADDLEIQKLVDLLQAGLILQPEYDLRLSELGHVSQPASDALPLPSQENADSDNMNEEDDGANVEEEEGEHTAASQVFRNFHYESFATYIYQVLKQVHPDVGISRKVQSLSILFIVPTWCRP